jgi:hypothetical protein
VLAQLWVGRRSVRIFARTVLGACGIPPPARNPRCDNHNRREQRNEQEDPRGHDPRLLQHPIRFCRLTRKKVHGSLLRANSRKDTGQFQSKGSAECRLTDKCS